MKKISCAIVEDDSVSLKLVELLAERTGMLEVKGSFSSPARAIPWLMKNKVDLLFLDVEMPEMTGLEMLMVLTCKPEVIIISGNPNYAIEAFDLTVTDYLLKPLKDFSRFLAAVNKAGTNIKSRVGRIDSANLFVKVDSLLININTEAIILVEAFGDYIKVHTPEKVHTVYATLKNLEEKLDAKRFVRVHRSYIINLTKITNINPNNLEIDKKIIPIGSIYKTDLLSKIRVL